jgi:small-conductance mechanosensitive channel
MPGARVHSGVVGRRTIERRLKATSSRLRSSREELVIIDEQLAHLADEAADSSLRAMVSDTPGVSYEARKAEEHAAAMAQHRAKVVASIEELERRQDELLDELGALRRE